MLRHLVVVFTTIYTFILLCSFLEVITHLLWLINVHFYGGDTMNKKCNVGYRVSILGLALGLNTVNDGCDSDERTKGMITDVTYLSRRTGDGDIHAKIVIPCKKDMSEQISPQQSFSIDYALSVGEQVFNINSTNLYRSLAFESEWVCVPEGYGTVLERQGLRWAHYLPGTHFAVLSGEKLHRISRENVLIGFDGLGYTKLRQ